MSHFKVMKMLNAGRGSVRFLSLNSAAPLRTKKGRIMDSIIRVDHAGEFGADRIYAGQMAILRNSPSGPMIEHMWKQEQVHRQKFEELIRKYGVRPTALLPVWNVAGFLLGASTALLGEKAAMACTVAVEDVIVEHYNDQLRTLMEIGNEDDKEILDTIKKFRDDELDHYDTGLKHGAKQAPFYEALTNVIKLSCKTAITISKVI
ncbi:PREDICTED: ubiquinone biosynthesis protein COQ7 homolog isoform X1 [Ceratosolen solmsi marchali]|uniref:5-demethoxyubiquinone hydroxylase, mitochondrial n=1 Tax=Ceratosolen solmsi marchali TaxID=326594 RepID=A0AAJ6YIM2_9HYME|nr:PREDICTED: ubiquinone biosynthesis protein COQ7 homolog isoform X1 [Ceratosolen solmsi marchali]